MERLVRPRGPDRLGAAADPARGRRAPPRPRVPAVRRRSLGRVRRGQRARQPGRQRAAGPRRRARRVGERAAAQLRGVRPGLVRHPQGRRGHEPDQHRVQGRLPQLDDQPGRVASPVHRRHPPRPAGAGRVRAAPAGARGRAAHGRRPRPRAVAALGDPGRADGGPRRRARRHRVLLDRRRPDHVHLGHHRALQGRHQAERGRLLLGAQRGRGDGRRARVRPRRPGRRDLLLVPAPVPLQPPGAVRLPGAARGRAGGLRRALLGHPVLAAGDRRRRHDLQRHRRDPLLPLEPAALAARPRARGAHDLRRAGPQGHLPRVRGALRRAADRGVRPHRDRRGHDDGPHPAAAAGQLRNGQPGLRGHDRGAGHRPARCPRTPRARSSWT